MRVKRIHFISGLITTLFVGLHLFNHVLSIFGANKYIEIMKPLRPTYIKEKETRPHNKILPKAGLNCLYETLCKFKHQ